MQANDVRSESGFNVSRAATQAAVSDALGNMRSSHADALRRLRELQVTSADKAERARLSLSEALKELQQRSRPSTQS